GFLRRGDRSFQMRRFERRAAKQVQQGIIRPQAQQCLGVGPSGLVHQAWLLDKLEGIENEVHTTTSISWNVVGGIERTEDYLYFVTNQLGTFIIPRRAFADDNAFIRFAETARSCLRTLDRAC